MKINISQFTNMISKLYPEFGEGLLQGEVATKVITFVLTQDCQLRCKYCYEDKPTCMSSKYRMSREVAKQAIDRLFEEYYADGEYINSKNTKVLIVEFIGGEPLLEIDLMNYIMDYLRFKAIKLNHPWATHYGISISTNGVAYDTPKVKEFAVKHRGRVSFNITIDGNKELHDSCRVFPDGKGSYDIVERAIKKHILEFGETTTKLTIAPENITHLFEAVKHLHDIGLIAVFANTVFEEGWDVSHAKIFYSEMKKIADYILDNGLYDGRFYTSLFEQTIGRKVPEENNSNWCGGNGKMLAIAPNGDLYPCLRYLPFAVNGSEGAKIGDIFNGIEHTNQEKDFVQCLRCITRRSQSTDECWNCPIGSGCAWCSAYNYKAFGTPDKRATYICIMHKARVLANAYYWNKFFKMTNSEERFELNIPEEWALEIIDNKELDYLNSLTK